MWMGGWMGDLTVHPLPVSSPCWDPPWNLQPNPGAAAAWVELVDHLLPNSYSPEHPCTEEGSAGMAGGPGTCGPSSHALHSLIISTVGASRDMRFIGPHKDGSCPRSPEGCYWAHKVGRFQESPLEVPQAPFFFPWGCSVCCFSAEVCDGHSSPCTHVFLVTLRSWGSGCTLQ